VVRQTREYINRPLTEFEQKMHDQERCIVCGVRVKKLHPENSGPPLECKECWKSRVTTKDHDDHRARLRDRSLMHREYSRRLGYGACSTGAPRTIGDGDDPGDPK
jgi:hypothetical protein